VHASGLWSDSDSHARGAILDRMLSLPRSRPLPNFIEPCLPRPADKPPAGRDWIHEIKHDGFRIMARRDAAGVRLLTQKAFFRWIILAVLAYREGWREVLFVLTTIEPSGDF
jgi:hypothetical protein